MRELTLEELKKIQIQILDVVDGYCRSNGINYWIDWGTLLGAVRHKGYIPWDDDIDIGMLRGDYDRFIYSFNKYNERYKVFCVENNPTFPYPYAKVLDTNTILYEPNEDGVKLAINIDVFVYDNAPDDDDSLNKMYEKNDFYNKMYFARVFKTAIESTGENKTIKNIGKRMLKLIPETYFCKKIIQNSKKYVNKPTQYVGNFSTIPNIKAPKTIFKKFVNLQFEGKDYMAPVGWSELLTLIYGDYMTLPPIEKRISHHTFKAFI